MIKRYDTMTEMNKKSLAEAEQAEIDENNDQATMNTTRQTEHDDFNQARTDDKGALDLMNRAKEAVSKFYKENTFLQEDPEFEKGEDEAPDAKFSDKGSHKNEAGGVIKLMDNIIEDLEHEIDVGEQEEVVAQMEYEKALQASRDLLKKLDDKQLDLDFSINRLADKTNFQKANRTDNEKNLKFYVDWEGQIKPDCDWLIQHYDHRFEEREQEIHGIEEAKFILAGAK